MKILCLIMVLIIPYLMFSQDLSFENQYDIDNYEGPWIIYGNVLISGEDISDLSNLENIEFISGELAIVFNKELVNFEGLENLDSVGSLWVEVNLVQKDFVGLDGLKVIQGDCRIGFCGSQAGHWNPELRSLEGLENLRYVGGSLMIGNCDSLSDISSIYNLDCVKEEIRISGSNLLKDCDLEILCKLSKSVQLDNGSDCSVDCGIESECSQLSILDLNYKKKNSIFIYPNPANDQISVISNDNAEIIQILIHNTTGILISRIDKSTEIISINNLPRGIYFVSLITKKNSESIKLVVN